MLITICLLVLAANSPDLLASGATRMGLGGLVESALLLARSASGGTAAGAAAAGAATGGATAAGLPGSGAPSVPASSVPRVAATPNTLSGKDGGTGGGTAVENKTTGFGRGGRSAGRTGSSGWAATNKGRGDGPIDRAANQ